MVKLNVQYKIHTFIEQFKNCPTLSIGLLYRYYNLVVACFFLSCIMAAILILKWSNNQLTPIKLKACHQRIEIKGEILSSA